MADPLVASNWAVAFALALPHILYAFLWFNPDDWRQAFKRNSVDVFVRCAWILKALQFSNVSYWVLIRLPRHGVSLSSISLNHWIIGLGLIIVGQILNAAVFKALGNKGVYYGFKFGHNIPWVTGFPFNVVSHPQYVGSAASVIGAATLFWEQAPSGTGLLALYWTLLYVLTAYMETHLHV